MTNQSELPPGVLRFEQFEPLLGQEFVLSIGEERLVLTLVEAELLPIYNPDVHWRPPFALVFTCPDRRILPQQMYVLDHPELPGADLFLVAIGHSEAGISYEAIFN